MDWITGNLYLVNEEGDILACDTAGSMSDLACATVVQSNDDAVTGLAALNPAAGYKLGFSSRKVSLDEQHFSLHFPVSCTTPNMPGLEA